MYAVWKNQLRNLSKEKFLILRELCRLSKNMYNVSLYSIRQYYFQEKKYLNYESNYYHCKSNENYQLLASQIAQQTMKIVDRNFKSFFSLISKARNGNYQFNQIKLPNYLPKDSYFSLIIPIQKGNPKKTIKDGFFNVPMSLEFRRKHGSLELPFPKKLDVNKIKEIRIHPKFQGRFFEVEFVYLQEQEVKELDSSNVLGIDLGLDNLATYVDNAGASFIIDGRRLKSINQYYNKENARLQGIKDKQNIKGVTEKQARIITNRNNAVNDYLNKTARRIIDYCILNKIGNVVIGYNLDWKRNINIGRVNNQKFVMIPHGNLRLKIQSLCLRYGVNYVEQEESYTSKASFFDNDDLPVFNLDNPREYCFSGKRIKRGLYQAKSGFCLNADVNGALNIIRKSKLKDLRILQCRGRLASPLRIRIV